MGHFFAFIKKELFLQSEKTNYKKYIKTDRNEKNISAIEQEKKKQTWFQRKNVNRKRSQSSESTSCKRKKKINCFGRTETQKIVFYNPSFCEKVKNSFFTFSCLLKLVTKQQQKTN